MVIYDMMHVKLDFTLQNASMWNKIILQVYNYISYSYGWITTKKAI